MLPSFWNRSVTVIRGNKVAGRGDDSRWDFDNPVEHVINNCFYAILSTGEDNTFRDGDSSKYVLRMPANADLRASDRVRLYVGAVDPEKPVFRVVGIVRDVPSGTGRMDHRRCELEAWEG